MGTNKVQCARHCKLGYPEAVSGKSYRESGRGGWENGEIFPTSMLPLSALAFLGSDMLVSRANRVGTL